jgi:glutathione synthase/RimK-type ligase-like ATP-grasp enzyme
MAERPRRRPGYVIVTDAPRSGPLARLPVCTADEYLTGEGPTLEEGLTVVNLCRSYQYLSKGYYVSLLADARHQRVVPTLRTIEAINDPFVYFRALEAAGVETIDYRIVRGGRRLLPKVIVPERDDEDDPKARPTLAQEGNGGAVRYARGGQRYTETTVVLGKATDDRFRRQGAAVFRVFPVPLRKVRMYQDDDGEPWVVGQIFPTALTQLGPAEMELLAADLTQERLDRATRRAAPPQPYRIACLWDERDPFAASDEETIAKFQRAAERQDALLDVIDKEDLGSLGEYDALFIRTVTGVDHYAFTFAQTAESLDMPVIDDPQSIIRCSNKVFLHELFEKHGIATPRTAIVSRKTIAEEAVAIGFPMIVKLPDGTFSHSVKKAGNREQLDELSADMFRRSPLLILQEFTPTAFDWRIGVLDGRILFAARYHMVKDHWQIVGRFKTGRVRYGRVEAVSREEVPEAVRSLALEAAALIGQGLYGVDVKESDAGPLVIEVNDNPNIVATDEDAIERDRLYDTIIATFLRRIRDAATEPRSS